MLAEFDVGRLDARVNNAPTTLKRAISKAKWRLLPFLMLLYLFNFLDRVNIGFATLQMNRDLGLSPTVFGVRRRCFLYLLYEP
jgi:ACS family tartrate transporter-like MFS transporter